MLLNSQPIAVFHFLDSQKWATQIPTNYHVSIQDRKELHITASQLKKESPHTILFYNNKEPYQIKMATDVTYFLKFEGEVEKGIQVQQVVVGYDKTQQQIFSVYNPLGAKLVAAFPKEMVSYSVGLRISGNGECRINEFSLEIYTTPAEKVKQEVAMKRAKQEYLIITNTYPDKNNYYQNMFVHKRAKMYQEKGIEVEVYRLNSVPGSISYYTYEGIPVYLSGEEQLITLLNTKKYKKIMFHFINERMYNAVRNSNAKYVKKIVWVHGFETTKWFRRWFNFYQDITSIRNALEQAKRNEEQLDFMRRLYTEKDDDLTFIFVSQWYKNNVAEKDTSTIVNNYRVIHNAIDDKLFNYVKKDINQRMYILTIRPFASRVYANDLVVKAILELKNKPFFGKLVFNVYGQGPLFDEVVEPIRGIPNVFLHNYFLSQTEISDLHKRHGIFLGASRMDSQGVSLGEAMSSGLVPVTNGIYAIPDFIDDNCGYLAEKEDYVGLSNAIEEMYHQPELFLKKSEKAAERIRLQCGKERIIREEIKEILK